MNVISQYSQVIIKTMYNELENHIIESFLSAPQNKGKQSSGQVTEFPEAERDTSLMYGILVYQSFFLSSSKNFKMIFPSAWLEAGPHCHPSVSFEWWFCMFSD